jgi:hypothetical protein
MKTKILILLILLVDVICKAQITLEHKFYGNTNWFQTTSGLKYYSIINGDSVSNREIIIYNSDYSIYKAIPINYDPPYYDIVGICFASDKLFNSDNLIEFIIEFGSGDGIDAAKLYNENGTQLFDFGSCSFLSVYLDCNKTKLLIRNRNYNGVIGLPDSCYIYSLPGQMLTAIATNNTETLMKLAYPNPTKNTITLPYNLQPGETSIIRIYNANGILIYTKMIDSNFDRIQLNVKNYSSGIYFYEINGKTSKFIVNKERNANN